MSGVAESIAISLLVSGISAAATYALTPTQKIQGNRLDSLTSATSSYGAPLPWAWGKVRLPEKRIWQDYLEPVSKKTNGKGTKVETENVSYFGYYASMFCECPFRPVVDYQRVWMNKRLVYSTIGGAETIAEGGKFASQYLRFYKGQPAQEIDPLLANATPISNYNYGLPANPEDRDNYLRSLGINPNEIPLTPAYNYRGYMVAQRLPLGDFFNALPRNEAEIIASVDCSVGQIIRDIMSLFFDSNRYDTSLIDTIPVQGFTLDSPQAAKNVIQTLQQAYFFDVAYSNGIYKFIPLNHPRDVINLSKEDLAAHPSGSEKPLDYEIIEADPTTLPSKVIVKYIDPDLNYDVNEQPSQLEVKGHYNSNPTRLDFPIVMTASEAATIADRALILAWIEKYLYKFQLPPAYLDLEPTDLIANVFDDRGYPIKLTQTRLGANLITECEGKAHDTYFWELVRILEEGGLTVGIADYNVVIETNGDVKSVVDTSGTIYNKDIDYTIDDDGNVEILSSGNIAEGTNLIVSTTAEPSQSEDDLGVIVSAGDTELLVMDVPLISNDDADFTLYLTGGGGDSWNGASIYISTDNSRFIFAGTLDSYGIFGEVINYSAPNGTIQVQVNKPELESITTADLDLGYNLALVGNKIYQYQTASLTDTNQYELSELTPGLRGTETQADPVIGDRFVLLRGENAVIAKIGGQETDIGEVRYFKAVSAGQTLDEVSAIPITVEGIAQRPYAPVNLSATKNGVGDISIEWDRRDRHDQSENPLLSETTEEYSIEILDINNGNAVARSISENNSYTTYSATDQTADFGSLQTSITIRIAQVSSSYGVGSYAQATLTPDLLEPEPTITSFAPISALIGATITVTGTDLAQVSAIKIGDIEQNNLAVTDNQNISFAIAPGTVSGLIEVRTTGGTTISNNPLIVEQPQTASGFPTSKKDINLDYLIDPTDFNLELTINAESGAIKIPDAATGFVDYWGCWISLDGTGTVTIERQSGGTSGIIISNSLGNDDTVKLWHRGGNVWKVD